MDIALFKTFLTVASCKNITHAAEILNFTQPAITAQIKLIEKEMQVSLFERIGKKIYLTQSGKIFMRHANNILLEYDLLKKDIDLSNKNISSLINVGVSTLCASYLVTPLLSPQNEFKNISLEICSNTDNALDGLVQNKFDFIICHTDIKNEKITKIALSKEKMVWTVGKELYLQHNQSLNIFDYPFISFKKGCTYRKKYEHLLSKLPNIIMECSNSESVRDAVLNNIGLSFLPNLLIKDHLNSGQLVELPYKPSTFITLTLGFFKNKHFSAQEQLFLDLLLKPIC
jgi:LysR family transcriptional regulator, transcriptional activator of the cysJI operon